MDADLDAVIAAERRRDRPRDYVIDALQRRRAAVNGEIDTSDHDRNRENDTDNE